jgi:4-amino-4-deoxy-L-arabinose transferase-like glycosyltransferase
MFDLVGFAAIFLVFLITFFTALRCKAVSKILLVAFLVRVLFLTINNHFFYLPDGDMDALNFELRAWKIAQVGFVDVFNYYPGPDAYFISFVLAIPYSLFGRSILMAQSFSIFFGIGCVFLGWLIAQKLWDNRTATKVAWVIALFPSAVSYSVLTMREVYISFFLLLAIFGIVKWVRDKDYKSIILTIFGFIAAAFFHGASIIGIFVFLFFVTLDSLKRSFALIKAKIISLKLLLIIFLSLFVFSLYVTNKIHIPYLKTFDKTINLEHMKLLMTVSAKGDASYPEWLKVESKYEFIYKIPIRTVYFLFSPFPWDVKKTSHLVGVFDSLLYMFLVYLIVCNRKVIWKDPALRIILLTLLCYFVIFGVGVSNFGTGIRHRVKFVFGLILLAGPLIPKFIFIKKNKFNTKYK